VPGVGEGGNPSAVGYVEKNTYSALTVDYHEVPLLIQVNLENRRRLIDPQFHLPPVPSNPNTFDRFAYSLNSPVRYTDPSGHFPVLAAALALAFTPVGVLVIGAAAIGITLYYTTGGPEAFANGLVTAGESISNGIQTLTAAKADTLKPGAFAGESIDARSPDKDFTSEEREAIDAIGSATGCHTCGTKDPGTKSGHFIPDHQPPSALNPSGSQQKLYPHCLNCSRSQGGQVRERLR
jgi:hypothetical protein